MRHRPVQTDDHHAARMPVTEAPKQFLGRQVFWLTADSGFRTTFPQPGSTNTCCSGLPVFGNLADHSGGPATASHRFPYYPRPPGWEPGNLSKRWSVMYQSDKGKSRSFSNHPMLRRAGGVSPAGSALSGDWIPGGLTPLARLGFLGCRPLQPHRRLCIARHAPVAARRYADRADLGTVR